MGYHDAYFGGYYGPPVYTTLEVAFDSDPGETPAWTDISDALERFTVNRGRQQELGVFSAGHCTAILNNADRRFDNAYVDSPYYPNIVPMRRVRIRTSFDDVTYDVFNGYADSWMQTYAPPQQAWCELSATDAFKVLSNTTLLTSAYAETVDGDGPVVWWRLGDTVVSNVAAEQLAGNLTLSPVGSPTFGAESLAINEPDGAITFPTGTDKLQGVFPEGTFPLAAAGSVSLLMRKEVAEPFSTLLLISTLNEGAETGLRVQVTIDGTLFVTLSNGVVAFVAETPVPGPNMYDGSDHHVAVTWSAGQPITIYVDGVDATASSPDTFTGSMASAEKWIVAVNGLDYPPYTFDGLTDVTVDELALFTSTLSAGQVAAQHEAAITAWRGDTSGGRMERLLDAADWSTADRNIDDGMAVMQSVTLGSSALDSLQRVEQTEQGRLFVTAAGAVRFIARDTLLMAPYTTSQATFGDSGSELEYGDLSYDDSDSSIVNEAHVSRSDGAVQIVRDMASQTRYLRRTLVLSGLEHQDDSTSRNLAQWLVVHYAEPFRRATGLKLEPSAGNEDTHFPQVLGRELGDRVRVKRRPQNLGAAIDQEVHIEGITHDVTATEWVTTWNLSPAETEVYWLAGVVGHSEAGTTTRAGF